MADEQPDTEHEIRRLFQNFAQEPLPDPPITDEALVAILRDQTQEECDLPEEADGPHAPDE